MSAVLGFKDGYLVGYFSTVEIAKEEGCDAFKPIEDEYIGEDNVIFYVKMNISTFFDDELEYVDLTHSTDESLVRFKDLVSEDFLGTICDTWLNSLTDEEKADIGVDRITPGDIIADIELVNCVAYPDEY